MSFSRKNRLVKKQDFQAIFTQSKKISHKGMLTFYRYNDKSYARLGIIIGKHFIKQATLRNQYRRIIRESFRHQQEIIKELDLIVVIRSKWSTLNKQLLRHDIDNLWKIIANLLRRA